MAELSEYSADAKGRPNEVVEVTTDVGTRIYLLPVQTFPGHFNNVYVIDHPDGAVLFDVGTATADAEIVARFDEAKERFGMQASLDDLSLAVISHAHIDHFGNAHAFRNRGVPIAIHELDARVIERFEERLMLASRDVGIYLRRCGLPPARVDELVTQYRMSKKLFSALTPDRRLRNGDRIGAGWEVIHVPGHCPGHVCLVVDDVVLTADHVLARITPTQIPQSITPYMGLENFLRSLERLRARGPFALGLGAHEAPIADVERRIAQTIAHHVARLQATHEACAAEPSTVAEVALALFGEVENYGYLLALFEAGAHVEYLHELGQLALENVDEVADDFRAAPRYRATDTDGRWAA